MKKAVFVLMILGLINSLSYGQNQLTQTVRGQVIDKESQSPVPGVMVTVSSLDKETVTICDADGFFRFQNIYIGRITLKAVIIGYEYTELRDIELKTGKELVLTIEMTEKVEELQEVVITGNRKDNPLNEMSTVSARSFTVEETERYAGTWLDPARMAANYAGVMAAGDQRNDIIIRGNSPLGLLWKLEGVNIPNPNHFGTLGTTGGPISILNNNLLTNSDFFTGAFPAEYGNALSGVFDLKMRSGNNEKYEFTAQVGMNGLEFGAEGPFSKKSKASFLLNYRYSTLAVFKFLDIHFGVSGVPEFQDISYKFNVPTEKAGIFSIFGVGGISSIEVFYEDKKPEDWSFGRDNLNFKFDSGMGATGISHFYSINKNSYIKTVIAVTGIYSSARADSANTINETVFYGDNSQEKKITASSKYTDKINSKNTFNVGFNIDLYKVQYKDSVLMPDETYLSLSQVNNKMMNLIGLFTQLKHKFTDEFSMTGGVYFQDFTLNGSYSVEPRFGLKWNFKPKHGLSFGAGILSQLQPRLFYFTETTVNNEIHFTNKDLAFTKSNQAVLSYDYSVNKDMRVKFETYYQYLTGIPIEQKSSSWSMVNYGTSFFEEREDSLVNKGTGENYGVELTFEKFLSKNYYFLFTSSLFESTYKGSDGIKRNTIYNGKYVFNLLAGYTFKLGKHNSINLDFKTVLAGGKHYIPIDLEASELAGMKIYDFDKAYKPKYNDYFRLDGRLGYKTNFKKFNAEIAFDVQNLTNRKNVMLESYDPDTNSITYDYQLGFFYVFFIRFQF